MNIIEQQLQWLGPYRLVGEESNLLFDQAEIESPGLYLWTIKISNTYLPYYVGETTQQTLNNRLTQHLLDYLIGRKPIVHEEAFTQGMKRFVWNPSEHKARYFQEYLVQYRDLSAHLAGMLEQFQIFIAPSRAEQRFIRRIEAGLIQQLVQNSAEVCAFQNTKSYQERMPNEAAIRITQILPEGVIIMGWSNSIEV